MHTCLEMSLSGRNRRFADHDIAGDGIAYWMMRCTTGSGRADIILRKTAYKSGGWESWYFGLGTLEGLVVAVGLLVVGLTS